MEQTTLKQAQSFYDPALFPWTEAFVADYQRIRKEVERVDHNMSRLYADYVEAISANSKKHRWFSLALVFFGIRNRIQLSRIPVIAQLLKRVPNLVTANLLKLEGDTHIRPHGGYTPDVLRCHFGVIVPEPKAGTIRVTSEQRHWEESSWLVFDDYLEHEVWYRGTKPRHILMIDVVRPELDLKPRQVAERFFNKVPGMRFDNDLEKVADQAQWMRWLDAGEFS